MYFYLICIHAVIILINGCQIMSEKTGKKFFWNRKSYLNWIFLITSASIFLFIASVNITTDIKENRKGDTKEYITLGYNLYKHGVFSLNKSATELNPTAHRSPAYPFLISACLYLSPDYKQSGLRETIKNPPINIKYVQLLLLLLSALASALLVWNVTGNSILCFITFWVISSGRQLNKIINQFMSEPLTMFCISALCLAIFIGLKKRKSIQFFISGLLLAILALNRAVYLYLCPVLFVFLLYAQIRQAFSTRKIAVQLLYFILPFVLITGSWMGRNLVLFDRPVIASRGGFVLNARAQYDMMNAQEYFASFFFWSGCPFVHELGNRLFPDEARAKLYRSSPDGYFNTAKCFRLSNTKENDFDGTAAKADRNIQKKAIHQILKHPFKHLMVTLPVALRGMYVLSPLKGPKFLQEKTNAYKRKKYFLNPFTACFLNIFLFLALFSLFINALLKNDLPLAAALLPAAFSFVFYSFLTHNLPRYNIPLIPILWASTMILLFNVYKKLWTSDTSYNFRQKHKSTFSVFLKNLH
jgi:hypothetical protein